MLLFDEPVSTLADESGRELYRILLERLPRTIILSIDRRGVLRDFHGRTIEMQAAAPRAATTCRIGGDAGLTPQHRPRSWRKPMLKMNYWTDKWDLHEDVCPCDVHFNDWVAKQKLKNKTIYHFGSGTHHVVGIKQAERKNRTLCITASKEEYEAYIDLVTDNSAVAKNYVCYFGDIYLTNPALLPEFDVVTMFHLCEFFFPNTASKEYGGLTDAKVLDLFTAKTRRRAATSCSTRARWAGTKPRRSCRSGRRRAGEEASASSRRCWFTGRSSHALGFPSLHAPCSSRASS